MINGDHFSRSLSPTSVVPLSGALPLPPHQLLADYRLAVLSRQLSVVGRREVLSGHAKFGIFGDGKEVAQLALAHVIEPGDWRAGYYRDQTLLLALGILTPFQFFSQLYGNTDTAAEPSAGGRAMINHAASRLLDAHGRWRNQCSQPNTSADISATAGQMPCLVGLAYASRLYRELEGLQDLTHFSHAGREVAFGTIGNGSCAEGLFWESLNAIGVLRAPAVISIWDDGYGISVPNDEQITGGDLSTLLVGFRRKPDANVGFELYTVCGWDYPALLEVYRRAAQRAREQQVPSIVHVTELTQPLGHSTSGSHERYKPHERLAWEAEYDPLPIMRGWLLDTGVADEQELATLEHSVVIEVEEAREAAQQAVTAPILAEARELSGLLERAAGESGAANELRMAAEELRAVEHPLRRHLATQAYAAVVKTRGESSPAREALVVWQQTYLDSCRDRYGHHLTSQSAEAADRVAVVAPQYAARPPQVRGFELLRANFDAWLTRDPRVLMFGEDVGRLGDVNQGAAGLQARHGELRVSDTGIREATIIGQAIGLALRGLRPIAEIQYLDYIFYALATLTDDLASLHWRTAGGQKAPVIVRTRGHRLEGIWHAGSPMAALLGTLRGMHLLVPRDMTRAAGFYNTLLRSDEPALVVEVLNGYRLYEPLPENLGDFTVPLGVPEVLRPGDDVTLVTYGASCRVAMAAAAMLAEADISVEVIDVQSLLPFDTHARIEQSLRKTGRLVVLDEDMPGGASAFILQQVLEVQGGYWQLDSPPRTVTGQSHRPAHGSDGDYFSKPNAEDVFTTVYELLHESWPAHYPTLWAERTR